MSMLRSDLFCLHLRIAPCVVPVIRCVQATDTSRVFMQTRCRNTLFSPEIKGRQEGRPVTRTAFTLLPLIRCRLSAACPFSLAAGIGLWLLPPAPEAGIPAPFFLPTVTDDCPLTTVFSPLRSSLSPVKQLHGFPVMCRLEDHNAFLPVTGAAVNEMNVNACLCTAVVTFSSWPTLFGKSTASASSR